MKLKDAEKNPRMKNQDLGDLLIAPVQRLPRIEMLLKDLYKHTEPDCQGKFWL